MVLRQKFWVDRHVQGVLIGRVALYWLCGVIYLAVGSICFQYYQNPDWSYGKHATVWMQQVWPWLPSLILVMPLVLFDMVRLSNSFVGPIYRLRRHLTLMSEDPECDPLGFRPDDYWQDLAGPVNNLQMDILELRAQVDALRQAARRPITGMAKPKSMVGMEDFVVKSDTAGTTPMVEGTPHDDIDPIAEDPIGEATGNRHSQEEPATNSDELAQIELHQVKASLDDADDENTEDVNTEDEPVGAPTDGVAVAETPQQENSLDEAITEEADELPEAESMTDESSQEASADLEEKADQVEATATVETDSAVTGEDGPTDSNEAASDPVAEQEVAEQEAAEETVESVSEDGISDSSPPETDPELGDSPLANSLEDLAKAVDGEEVDEELAAVNAEVDSSVDAALQAGLAELTGSQN